MTMKNIYRESAALFLGGLTGAGVALLFAPKSGRKIRRNIGNFAEDVKARTECYLDEAKWKVRSALHKGSDFFEEKKSIITTAVEAGKEAYKKETERFAKQHA